MFGEALLIHLLATELGQVVHAAVRRRRFITCSLVRRDEEVRFAFSALLRLGVGSSYLLVRNLHRPETFGPFGGVYKYHDEARVLLDRLEFRPQHAGPGSDMRNDLRGFIPRRSLPALVRWYTKRREREECSDCLSRELREELAEIGISRSVKPPRSLTLKLVRNVAEGPEKVPGQGYTQFRIFEVFDIANTDKSYTRFLKQVGQAVPTSPHLLSVTPEEIIVGRARGGEVIGHHACYFLRSRRIRPDSPMFVGQSSNAFKEPQGPTT